MSGGLWVCAVVDSHLLLRMDTLDTKTPMILCPLLGINIYLTFCTCTPNIMVAACIPAVSLLYLRYLQWKQKSVTFRVIEVN